MSGPPEHGLNANATVFGATVFGASETLATEPRAKRVGVIEPGYAIGRYVTLYRLGEGGMGVVFAAYDPHLDRKVAIKLLAAQSGDLDRAHSRLQREAQALAKLNHRNVVSVHDVGVHEGKLFVAMEFVAGCTLGDWMRPKSGPRPWREVLAVFIEAGRGLAAAHEMGLIHRDFKPDNVMIGDDGGVRVMDFGLARSDGEKQEPVNVFEATMEVDRLTKTGAILGTPAYMSLEQFRGGEVDARSDQFSFCASLFEALHGRRAFTGPTIADLVHALETSVISEPASTNVPTWVNRALAKGLAKDPAQRWPTMAALLDALADDPAPRRRRWAAASLIVTILGGTMWAMVATLRADAETCRGAEQKLVGVWDDERRASVEQAILSTGLNYAPDTWGRVQTHLDAYADAWAAARTEACEATRQGEQSDQLLDLRMACLDQRREHLMATIDELEQADPQIVEGAVQLVLALPSLEPCADADALLAATPPPEDPAVAEKVATLDEQLLLARAKADAGNYDDALRRVDVVVEDAVPLAYEPLLARAWLQQGILRDKTGNYDGAIAALRQALDAAVAQRMLDEAAQVTAELTFVVGQRLSKYDAGREWASHADSFSRAVGTDELRAEYLVNLGILARAEGKYAEARGLLERALALREHVFGTEHPLVADVLTHLGNLAHDEGNFVEARRHLDRALAITETVLGPEHPKVADALSALAIVAWSSGEYAEARSTNERVLAIRERALGPEHPAVAATLNNLGNMAVSNGDFVRARAYFERSIAIREKVLGSKHRSLSTSFTSLGNLDEQEGKLAEARSNFERALEILDATVGPDHPDTARALANLGNVAKSEGNFAEALSLYERARVIWLPSMGADHPMVIYLTSDICDSLVDLDRAEEALAQIEPALKNLTARDPDPLTLANVRFVLARALWDVPADKGRDRKRARELADLARGGIAETGQGAKRLAEMDAWLAGHEP